MRNRKSVWRAALAGLLTLILAACADLQRRPPSRPAAVTDVQQHLDVSADQLLAFGSEYDRLGPAGRLAGCHKLLRTYAVSRRLSTLLYVFSAQLVTEGCGDLAETTRVVRAFRGQIQEERLRNLLAYQGLLAEQNIARSLERERLRKRLEFTRYQMKKALSESRQAVSSSKQALTKQREALSEREQALTQTREIYRQMVSRDAEARQLKEKLDALKSIEQDLNDTER